MAIGPQAARESMQATADFCETQIDGCLKRATAKKVTLDTKSIRGLTYDIWGTMLRRKYIDAGWKLADWQSDQRDGDYLIFHS